MRSQIVFNAHRAESRQAPIPRLVSHEFQTRAATGEIAFIIPSSHDQQALIGDEAATNRNGHLLPVVSGSGREPRHIDMAIVVRRPLSTPD
jgi:hypothetical protein